MDYLVVNTIPLANVLKIIKILMFPLCLQSCPEQLHLEPLSVSGPDLRCRTPYSTRLSFCIVDESAPLTPLITLGPSVALLAARTARAQRELT